MRMKGLAGALTVALALVLGSSGPRALSSAGQVQPLWQEVEVIRTAHGVPHIRAENLRAAGYALAWVQCEDYGDRTPLRLAGARGLAARFNGRRSIEADFEALRARDRAIETYHLLDQETRDIYDGFAAGVNRFVRMHPELVPTGMPSDFTGYDVAALHIGDGPSTGRVRRFLAALEGREVPDETDDEPYSEDGSNAWALAPSRTKSRRAILLRNPHLAWTAGYYEAHVTVPGILDFYGDYRIGGPFGIIGGFNRDLGWATTNSNSGDLTEIYALPIDPEQPDHYLLDGASLRIAQTIRTVEFLTDEGGLSSEMREIWSTPIGPVIHRTDETIYVAKTAGDLEFRAGEQFLRMMRARSLGEWLDAMRIRALVTSNYTYADRAGNIFYLWNAALPRLPHERGAITPAREMRDLWTQYLPFALLPRVYNPPGGYIHNENDSPHFTNVRGKIPREYGDPSIEPPRLRLRSQHAIELIGTNNKRYSLEDVIRLKHSYRMLLADRVKEDLIDAVEDTRPEGAVKDALELIDDWDNTAAPDSQGAILFEAWWRQYSARRPDEEQFANVWSEENPLKTPRGLADPARAVYAFASAVEETTKRYGRLDVAWGDVHRVRRGTVDVPVGGCSGALGCFRVLGFTEDETDARRVATTGDGWVLVVEFDDVPRAYSVLAYGQSPNPESPWHADQAEMFARGEMKKVAFTEKDVDAQAVRRYRPGADVVPGGR